MRNSKTNRLKEEREQRSRSDLPDWVTHDLLQQTVENWQPYYSNQLTREDAIAIINNVGGVIDCLRREK